MLRFMGSQRVRHDWATELNWTEQYFPPFFQPYLCCLLPKRYFTIRCLQIFKVQFFLRLSSCLFNLYAEYVLWNVRLIKVNHKLESRLPGEISTTRYADDTTLMADSKEELNSLLMRVREENEKPGLDLNFQNKLRSWNLVPSFHDK